MAILKRVFLNAKYEISFVFYLKLEHLAQINYKVEFSHCALIGFLVFRMYNEGTTGKITVNRTYRLKFDPTC